MWWAFPGHCMYVCLCHGVTDHAIRDAAARGVRCLDALATETGLGTCCGACRPLAQEVLGEASAPAQPLRAAHATV
jgi:bacterioferritin-associated ferredoxin